MQAAAAQGLHAEAQGLHAAAAQGLHAAAQGLHAAAQGLQGLAAAQGLQAAATWKDDCEADWASPPMATIATPTPMTRGTNVVDRSLLLKDIIGYLT